MLCCTPLWVISPKGVCSAMHCQQRAAAVSYQTACDTYLSTNTQQRLSDHITAAECMSLLIGHFYTPRSKSWTDMKCPRHTGCVLERCGPYLCRFAKLLYLQLVCTALSHHCSCDRTVNCTRSITLLLTTCVVLQLLL